MWRSISTTDRRRWHRHPSQSHAAIRNDGIYRAVFDPVANDYRDLNAAEPSVSVAGAAPGVKWKKLGEIFPRRNRQR